MGEIADYYSWGGGLPEERERMPMQEYKVLKVSEQEPKKWDGPNGTIYYIKTMLEGHDKPVSIGKKSPNALKVGDTVYGEIQPSDYIEDKFKAGQNPNYGAKKPAYDGNGQKHGAALKIAADFLLQNKVTDNTDDFVKQLEALSTKIFAIQVPTEAKKDWIAPEVREKLTQPKEPEYSDDDFQASLGNALASDEPINLDDIPF